MPVRAKSMRSTPQRRTVAVHGKADLHRRAPHARTVRKVINFAPSKTSHPVSSYTKAMRFLNSLSDYERLRIVRYTSQNFDLDRMRTLLRKLGNPQDKFKSVHVAGTKGKGSTCAMIASMLQAAGYKVGLYTSPHLVDIRERIQVNGEMISTEAFGKLVKMVDPVVAKIKPLPKYFDVLTAVASQHFAD